MPNAREYLFSHTTTSRKNDPIHGVEGLAIELEKGAWIFPGRSKEMDRLVTACLQYTPTKHLDDVMAALYFARELAKRIAGSGSRGGGTVNVRIIGGGESSDGRDHNGMRTVLPSGPTPAELAYQASLFEAAGDEPVEIPAAEPEPANPLRRTAANANDLTTGHRDSIFHRLFDVGEPANEASEIGGTSKRELDARAALRDGASRIETDEEEDRTPGSWKRGGWGGGGVL